MTPLLVVILANGARPVFGRLTGVIGRMVARGVVTNLSCTGAAVALLTVAITAAVSVGIMIDSFRGTASDWLEPSLQADIYVQPPSLVFRGSTATLDSTPTNRLRGMDGIAASHSVRRVPVQADVGRTELLAVEPGSQTEEVYQFKSGDPDTAWPALWSGASVIVSEPYGYRYDMATATTWGSGTPCSSRPTGASRPSPLRVCTTTTARTSGSSSRAAPHTSVSTTTTACPAWPSPPPTPRPSTPLLRTCARRSPASGT